MKIERDKTYLTRDGRKARVVCVDAVGTFPIIAAVKSGTGEWPEAYAADGSFYSDPVDGPSNFDLVSEYVEPPKPREIWANFYSCGPASVWNTKEEAAAAACGNDSIPVLFREVIE